jgi:hypothetical protein
MRDSCIHHDPFRCGKYNALQAYVDTVATKEPQMGFCVQAAQVWHDIMGYALAASWQTEVVITAHPDSAHHVCHRHLATRKSMRRM